MKFSDPDEARFVADQLAEVRDSMGVDNARAARLIVALDAEAPDAGVLMELMVIAGERLAQRAGAGDEEARNDLETLLRIVAGLPRGDTAERAAEASGEGWVDTRADDSLWLTEKAPCALCEHPVSAHRTDVGCVSCDCTYGYRSQR